MDGIEASGLGADLELLVDRTPKRNHLARSTPELIVKRLVEKSTGHAKALFGDILGMFAEETDQAGNSNSTANSGSGSVESW